MMSKWIILCFLLEIMVKNCYGIICYNCASPDKSCWSDVWTNTTSGACSPTSNTCTIMYTASIFGATISRGCQTNCVASSHISGSDITIVTCCSTDLCNGNIALPTTTTTTTSTTTTTTSTTTITTTTTTNTETTTTSTTTTTTTVKTTTAGSSRNSFQFITLAFSIVFTFISSL